MILLLVDFTNQLREQGVELTAAIEQAGEIRFLPVVLTSLTAIGGLIPLALNSNPQISPLALVLIGRLISYNYPVEDSHPSNVETYSAIIKRKKLI